MLGTADTRTEELRAQLRERDAQIDRIEQIAESIAYTAPELAEAKRAEIVQSIRRVIREWKAGR